MISANHPNHDQSSDVGRRSKFKDSTLLYLVVSTKERYHRFSAIYFKYGVEGWKIWICFAVKGWLSGRVVSEVSFDVFLFGRMGECGGNRFLQCNDRDDAKVVFCVCCCFAS